MAHLYRVAVVEFRDQEALEFLVMEGQEVHLYLVAVAVDGHDQEALEFLVMEGQEALPDLVGVEFLCLMGWAVVELFLSLLALP